MRGIHVCISGGPARARDSTVVMLLIAAVSLVGPSPRNPFRKADGGGRAGAGLTAYAGTLSKSTNMRRDWWPGSQPGVYTPYLRHLRPVGLRPKNRFSSREIPSGPPPENAGTRDHEGRFGMRPETPIFYLFLASARHKCAMWYQHTRH
jgi:hypothetical protein